MNTVTIKKTDITALAVDCIVNAANSGLMAGGGVCGAIFRAAGARELQAACDEYGGCKTGSAVITPGFRLKAKYVIHAVGPVWNGGNNGEEELLYSCYQASMRLAVENNCLTIAFPLISSGIYGYPKKAAWEVAIKAVRDFQKENDNAPDVTFAVISDDMLLVGNRVLYGEMQVVRFHKPEERNGYMSNWYMRDFLLDEKTYCCVEQCMMEQKALLFGDTSTARKIMQTNDPQEMQDLGRQAAGFEPKEWDGRKQIIVYRAVKAKFEQNPDLLEMLKSTGNATPAECSRSDKVWGIGLGMDDPAVDDMSKWRGQNLLGFTLKAVRDELKKQHLDGLFKAHGHGSNSKMDKHTIFVKPEDVRILDNKGNIIELSRCFARVPEVAKPLVNRAKSTLSHIEQELYTTPAFINAVQASVPDVTLQAVLSDEQKRQLAKGAIKLMTKKDGSLMANLVNPKTRKIIKTIPLKSVKMTPEITQAMTNLSTQMQMVQIAEQIQSVQIMVEEVRMGQENDRLATAYSCQQKLLQALAIKNPELRTMALINIVADTEDSRNLLMLSQKSSVKFILDQPESFFQKLIAGSSLDKINSRMSEIRESLYAVNMVSLSQAMAYQELGECEAARKSLRYYASFIEDTYTSVPGLTERLDMIDPAPENYWSKTLPDISKKIKALPKSQGFKLLESEKRRRKIQ